MSNAEPDVTETMHGLEARGVEIGAETAPSHVETDTSQESEVERAREVGAPAESDERLASGGGGRPRRLLLVGLGGATPNLALNTWRGELRTLDLLLDRGAWCRMRGGLPWTSMPAWASLFSGLDAGQLGIYGPGRRLNRGYDSTAGIDSRAIRDPRLWDILSAAGKHVGVVGAPATTPAPAVHGHLIGDSLLPDGALATFPASLAQLVASWLGETALRPAAPAPTADNLDRRIQSAYIRAEERFMLARRLLARDMYDCFVLVDDGIATVQRALWDSFDSTHPRFTPNHPFAGAIGSFYRFVDDQLFELLELVDDDTLVAIVSPSGAQALHGELALNEWLIEQGDLKLRSAPTGLVTLDQCEIDWEHSRAWADHAGAIYLNVAGREPLGAIPADQAERARTNLAARLRALTMPDGAPALEVYRPEVVYAAVQGVAPDLIATCAQPGWRTTANLGSGVWSSAMQDQPDTACETPDGFLIVYDPRSLGGGRQLDDTSIYDIMPTLLALFGQPIPTRLRGQSIPGLQ